MSYPECLDELRFSITRMCDGLQWTPTDPPTCTYYHFDVFEGEFILVSGFSPFSFDPYTGNYQKIFVYTNIEASLDNTCLENGLLGDQTTGDNLLSEVWYWSSFRRLQTFHRFIDYRFGPTWGKLTDEHLDVTDYDCMVRTSKTHITQGESCERPNLHLCAVDLENPVMAEGCFDGGLMIKFRPTKCYKLLSTCDRIFTYGSSLDKHILRAFRRELELGDDEYIRIQIAPFQGNEQYEESFYRHHVNEDLFTNWAPDILPEEKLQRGVIVSGLNEHWRIVPEDSVEYTLCETDLSVQNIEMFLRFNSDLPALHLVVYNQEFLYTFDTKDPHIVCYTTATDDLLANVEVLDEISHNYNEQTSQSTTIYNVELLGGGPGQYWCSAIRVPDYEIISSPSIIAFSSGVQEKVFSFKVIFNCWVISECVRFLLASHYTVISQLFSDTLRDAFPELLVENTRVMEVISYDRVQLNLHLHSTISVSISEIPLIMELFSYENPKDEDFTEKINMIFYINERLKSISSLVTDQNYVSLTFVGNLFYCISEVMNHKNEPSLMFVEVNNRVIYPRACDDVRVYYWHCQGSFPGAPIFVESETPTCFEDSVLSRSLFEIAISSSPTTIDDMEQVKTLIYNSPLAPIDLFFVGVIQRSYVRGPAVITVRDMPTITNVFSSSQNIRNTTAQISNEQFNATNILVDFYEKIACDLAINLDETNELGVVMFTAKNTITAIIDPSVTKITGFALMQSKDPFLSPNVRFLYANTSLTDLMADNDLESATFIPQELLDSLQESNVSVSDNELMGISSLTIVLSIIKNDVLFRPSNDDVTLKPVSKVIQVSIPGYSKNLTSLYPILFRAYADFRVKNEFECGFWDFHAGSDHSGKWSNEGCIYINKSSEPTNPVVLCSCDHLTNFAFLMTGNVGGKPPPQEFAQFQPPGLNALDIITVTGCALSILGVLGIWATALLFQSWRGKRSSKILLHLSLAIGIQTTSITLINFKGIFYWNKTLCIVFGVILHYSVLVSFFWMLVVSYLQYLRYVVVIGKLLPKRFLAKATLFGWGLPLVPVFLILITNHNLYVPAGFTEFNPYFVCYPQAEALHFCVILPVALVFIINLNIFVWVSCSIRKGLKKHINPAAKKLIQRQQLRLIVFLFFALGLTWGFSLLVHVEGQSLIFTVLFSITASLQGFVLFVYFICLDPMTRALWKFDRQI